MENTPAECGNDLYTILGMNNKEKQKKMIGECEHVSQVTAIGLLLCLLPAKAPPGYWVLVSEPEFFKVLVHFPGN